MKFFLLVLLVISHQAFPRSETESKHIIDKKIKRLWKKDNPSHYERALMLLHRDDFDQTQAWKRGEEPPYRERDLIVAVKVLKLAIEEDEDNEKALYVLAKIVRVSGSGIESLDQQDSVRFFKKSAAAGYPPALHQRGLHYLYGHTGSHVVEQDDKKAFDFFRRAAKKGSLRSQARLAYMYFEGRGVAKDTEKSRLLWLDAAQKGLYRAYSRLAYDWYDRGALSPNIWKYNEYHNKFKNNEDRRNPSDKSFKEGDFLHGIFLNFEDFML